MNNKIKVIAIVSVLFVLLTGCRSTLIMNIDGAPLAVKEKTTSQEIENAIIRAGRTLGWVMKIKKDGHVLASLYLRTHVAIVDITYDKKTYSIKYKDSTDLDYDGNNIHSNYNGWIENLNRAIQMQLSSI